MREITVISHPEPKPNDEKRPLPEIDMAAVKTREERAVARAQEEAAQINTAVTVRAQAIFDALRKTCAAAPRGGAGLRQPRVVAPSLEQQGVRGAGRSTGPLLSRACVRRRLFAGCRASGVCARTRRPSWC